MLWVKLTDAARDGVGRPRWINLEHAVNMRRDRDTTIVNYLDGEDGAHWHDRVVETPEEILRQACHPQTGYRRGGE